MSPVRYKMLSHRAPSNYELKTSRYELNSFIKPEVIKSGLPAAHQMMKTIHLGPSLSMSGHDKLHEQVVQTPVSPRTVAPDPPPAHTLSHMEGPL